jgi:hypothetical protein
MSQSSVERVIGVLATDEAFRSSFAEDPHAAIRYATERGLELTPCERRALVRLDPQELDRFAASIDARLQKTDLRGGV